METTYRYLQDEQVALDDGSDFSNAVFRRCNLTYAGGPLRISGATFYDCGIRFEGDGTRAADLQRAIFASLYAQGRRTLRIDEDGDYEAF